MAHYYACKFGVNRLRIDGVIRYNANVAVAMYRLGRYNEHDCSASQ